MGILDDKVVIITGGARGMGAAHARHLVQEGARVVIGDLRDDVGKEVADELGEAAVYAHHDVTSPEAWEDVVGLATRQFGRVDGLVNNAGVLEFKSIADTTPDEFRTMLDINLTGAWLGIKSVAPVLAAGGGGSVVNVSSTNGFVGSANLATYTASKFAVRGLTKAAAAELGPAGIRVNSIHPGGIATPMTTGGRDRDSLEAKEVFRRFPIPRWGEPEEVSPLVALLLSEQASFCTGSEYVVDGGLLCSTSY